MSPIIQTAVKAARRAGQILIRQQERLHQVAVREKSLGDFTSDADRLAEEEIIQIILGKFPHHRILAEESGAVTKSAETAQNAKPAAQTKDKETQHDYEWIIDPLDGTANFLHGHAHFCVSIAVRCDARTEHAVILDPLRDELFSASRGQGAQLNARRLRVSGRTELQSATIAGAFRAENSKKQMRALGEILSRGARVHASGSAALDLAYVAAGRMDGAWFSQLQSWDVGAGALLVREAGGLVADFGGGDKFWQGGEICAANQEIFNPLLQIVGAPSPD